MLKNNTNIARVLIWKDATAGSDTGFLSRWQGGRENGDNHWLFKFGVDDCKFMAGSDKNGKTLEYVDLDKLQSMPLNNGKEWTIEQDGGRSFQVTESGLRIKPGNRDIILVFPAVELSPLKATIAEIQARVISGTTPPVSFMWSAGAERHKRKPPNDQRLLPRFTMRQEHRIFQACHLP